MTDQQSISLADEMDNLIRDVRHSDGRASSDDCSQMATIVVRAVAIRNQAIVESAIEALKEWKGGVSNGLEIVCLVTQTGLNALEHLRTVQLGTTTQPEREEQQ